jgi:hypothetical protein
MVLKPEDSLPLSQFSGKPFYFQFKSLKVLPPPNLVSALHIIIITLSKPAIHSGLQDPRTNYDFILDIDGHILFFSRQESSKTVKPHYSVFFYSQKYLTKTRAFDHAQFTNLARSSTPPPQR